METLLGKLPLLREQDKQRSSHAKNQPGRHWSLRVGTAPECSHRDQSPQDTEDDKTWDQEAGGPKLAEHRTGNPRKKIEARN